MSAPLAVEPTSGSRDRIPRCTGITGCTAFAIRYLATGDTLSVALTKGFLPRFGHHLILRDGSTILDSALTIEGFGSTYGQEFETYDDAFLTNEAVYKGNSATGFLVVRCVMNGRFRTCAILRSHTYTIVDGGEFELSHRFMSQPYRLLLVESFAYDRATDPPHAGSWSREFQLAFDDDDAIFHNDSLALEDVPTVAARDGVSGLYPAIRTVDSLSVWIDGAWYGVLSGPYAFARYSNPEAEAAFMRGRVLSLDTIRGSDFSGAMEPLHLQ